jgi:hypothetical protein
MIYTDDDGVVNIEYGHGTIMGFALEKHDDGSYGYSLAVTDPHEIGAPCENFENIVGKPDADIGVSVRFRFLKIKSLDMLIEGLNGVRKEMSTTE